MKLNEFGVDLESDIVAITTDGCVMMKKTGTSSWSSTYN